MFDFDASKLIIVGIIALIFIPPKDLPRVLRQAGQLVGKMRRMASEFQGQFMDAMREADMEDLRKEAKKLADSTKIEMGLSDIDRHNRSLMQSIDRSGSSRSTIPPELEPTEGPAADAPTHAEARPTSDTEPSPRPVTHPA